MLAATAIAGVLLWLAAQFGRHTTGSYWAAYGIVAAAGLVFGLAQLRGRTGHPPAMFVLGFLPVFIVGGWVLLAMQPQSNWTHSHVVSWSGNIGVLDVVRDLGTWLGVLAFGIGYMLGAVLEPAPVRRPVERPVDSPVDDRRRPVERPVEDREAMDAPTTAERREVTRDEESQPVR